MNEYVQMLYEEHEIIIEAIEIAKNTQELIGKDNAQYEKKVRQLIYFFRNYADKYHHHKEELILFPAMKQKNEMIGEGIIQEMLENHDTFRGLIKAVEKHLAHKEYEKSYMVLRDYTHQLLNHIAAEDDELFIMTDQLFNEYELEKIKFQFEDCDRDLGMERKEELKNLLEELK